MKRKHFIALIVPTIVALVFVFGFKQPSEKPAVESNFHSYYIPIWENATQQVLEIAEAMPEDKYGYKPTDVSRSFGQQIVHIGNATKAISDMYLKGEKPNFEDPSADGMSKKEVIAYVTAQLAAAKETIQSLSDEQLNEMITSFAGNKMTKQQAIMACHDHLTNHKAKANLYVRLNNIDPPKYRYY